MHIVGGGLLGSLANWLLGDLDEGGEKYRRNLSYNGDPASD
jgi:hypothetical protein